MRRSLLYTQRIRSRCAGFPACPPPVFGGGPKRRRSTDRSADDAVSISMDTVLSKHNATHWQWRIADNRLATAEVRAEPT